MRAYLKTTSPTRPHRYPCPEPILFVGDDFSRTDLVPALP